VVAASRHGSTAEIAAEIARSSKECGAGRAVGLAAAADDGGHGPDPARFDAVVLGSAVYAGRWLEQARQYATDHTTALGFGERAMVLTLPSATSVPAPPSR
jgi:menaquinone-dependent protoporphyrinogen oxidase